MLKVRRRLRAAQHRYRGVRSVMAACLCFTEASSEESSISESEEPPSKWMMLTPKYRGTLGKSRRTYGRDARCHMTLRSHKRPSCRQ